MMTIIGLLFDLVLIGLLGVGISFAMKLVKQLNEMRASRTEMERFVLGFNATVNRAEAGIRGLKEAARSSGDDLEQLIEKGQSLRDELIFLTESADQIASRLSQAASMATRTAAPLAKPKIKAQAEVEKQPVAEVASLPLKSASQAFSTASAAEKELLRVLKKMG